MDNSVLAVLMVALGFSFTVERRIRLIARKINDRAGFVVITRIEGMAINEIIPKWGYYIKIQYTIAALLFLSIYWRYGLTKALLAFVFIKALSMLPESIEPYPRKVKITEYFLKRITEKLVVVVNTTVTKKEQAITTTVFLKRLEQSQAEVQDVMKNKWYKIRESTLSIYKELIAEDK